MVGYFLFQPSFIYVNVSSINDTWFNNTLFFIFIFLIGVIHNISFNSTPLLAKPSYMTAALGMQAKFFL